MRILHTSDWHLGRMLHERSLLDDQRVFLDWLVDRLATDRHDALVIAGDVFDRSVPPEAAVDAFGRFLRDVRRAAPSTEVVVVAGNHDSGSRLAYASELLEGIGVHVRGEADALERPVRLPGRDGVACDVYCVPFLWPGMISAHGEDASVPLVSQAEAMREAIARVHAVRDPSRLAVLVAHAFVAGGSESDSERVLLGQAARVPPTCFEGFDYVALGHLHRPQRLGDRIRYSGSPLAYSFSESTDRKTVLSVTLRAAEAPEVESIPVPPVRRMTVLRGTMQELLLDEAARAHVDDYVKVELTEPAHGGSPFSVLKARFPNLLALSFGAASESEPALDEPGQAQDEEREDPERDFVAFARHVRGADAPTPATLELFRAIRSEVEAAR